MVSNFFCDLVENKNFESFIILVVIFNTVILAMDGLFHDDPTLDLFQNMSLAFTIIFTMEFLSKLIAYGPRGNFKMIYVKEITKCLYKSIYI